MKRSQRPVIQAALTLAPLLIAPAAVAHVNAAAGVDQTLVPYASMRDSVRLPDGRTVHLVCMGHGAPVVILTAGAGGWSVVWSKVQPAVALKTRVCAWDRAGYGFSDPSPKPQTVDNTTSDLEAALSAGGVAPPYVLVGHSLGAYESLLLADRRPSDVVGMVLVDPSVPDQTARFDRVTPAMSEWMRSHQSPTLELFKTCAAALRSGTAQQGGPTPARCLSPPPPPPDYPPELRAAMAKRSAEASPAIVAAAMDTMASFMSSIDEDSKTVVKPDRNYGAMPLIVLTRTEFDSPPDFSDAVKAEIPAEQAEWKRAHAEYAALSTRGVDRAVAGSSHDIPEIKPQAVIDAIDEVVDEARASRRTATAR